MSYSAPYFDRPLKREELKAAEEKPAEQKNGLEFGFSRGNIYGLVSLAGKLGVSSPARFILLTLALYADAEKMLALSIQELAIFTGYSDYRVRSSLDELQNAGLIKIHPAEETGCFVFEVIIFK